MTDRQFQEWFAHHGALFTGITTWLAKIPERPREGMPSRETVLGAWFRQLRPFELDEAKRASENLSAWDESDLPKAFDRHPAAVAAIIRRTRRARPRHRGPRYVGGQQVFRCLTCRDTGAVSVFHAETMQGVGEGGAEKMRTGKTPMYTAAVRCACEAAAGQAWMDETFDPRRMLPVEAGPTLRDQLPALEAFLGV